MGIVVRAACNAGSLHENARSREEVEKKRHMANGHLINTFATLFSEIHFERFFFFFLHNNLILCTVV